MQGRNPVSVENGSRSCDPENINQTSPARIKHNVVHFNIGVVGRTIHITQYHALKGYQGGVSLGLP